MCIAVNKRHFHKAVVQKFAFKFGYPMSKPNDGGKDKLPETT